VKEARPPGGLRKDLVPLPAETWQVRTTSHRLLVKNSPSFWTQQPSPIFCLRKGKSRQKGSVLPPSMLALGRIERAAGCAAWKGGARGRKKRISKLGALRSKRVHWLLPKKVTSPRERGKEGGKTATEGDWGGEGARMSLSFGDLHVHWSLEREGGIDSN